MDARVVEVVPLGDVDARAVETVRAALTERFPVEVRAAAREPLPEEAYDEERWQYDAEEILIAVADVRHRLAIVDAGIFHESKHFLFGLALIDGPAAVFSTARLRSGREGGDGVVGARIRKQAIKNVGRMLGLEECDRRCVNRPTPTVEELDETPGTFCPDCRRTLGLPSGPGESSESGARGAEDQGGTDVEPSDDDEHEGDDTRAAASESGNGAGREARSRPKAVAPTKEDIATIEREGESAEDRTGPLWELVHLQVSAARLLLLVGVFVGVFVVVGAGAFWLLGDVLGVRTSDPENYAVLAASFLVAAYLTWELRNLIRAIVARVGDAISPGRA